MTAPPEWINDYIGAPHKTNGRDINGFDCWGLMMAVWRDHRGVELPDFQAPAGSTFPEAVAELGRVHDAAWPTLAAQVDAGTDWDFVVVVRRRAALHIGLLLGGGVLHSAHKAGTVWDPESRFNFHYPTREYWRWLD